MNRYLNVLKEVECLYLIDAVLQESGLSDALRKIANIIPLGFRNMNVSAAVVVFDGQQYCSKTKIKDTDYIQTPIIINCVTRGYVRLMYEKNTFIDNESVFLSHNIEFLNKIAKRISFNIMHNSGQSACPILPSTDRCLRVELIRKFLVDDPKLISRIQEYIPIGAFCELLDTYISNPKSIGKIGGKGAGLFIAYQIIKSKMKNNPELRVLSIPRTWHIAADKLENLLICCNLGELKEHKYRDITDIHSSYPRIIQMFKNSELSPYILRQLDGILEVCQDKPLIVRSSSLLEGQVDSSFSGKYKSLFIPNVGSKKQRQQQLMKGILEVYASLFDPDSIQYRKERKLLDSDEQMGIMIQEVVGRRVGHYYFPLYTGVAFSYNELPWSSRLKRDDGFLRIVPGLGTRAVDRVGEDYPILISLGQSNSRLKQAFEHKSNNLSQMVDVIDLEKGQLLTLPLGELIKEYEDEIPHANFVASSLNNDLIKSVMAQLQDILGYPVELEFANDGEKIYLLQCRYQIRSKDNTPAAIPMNIPYNKTIFTADKYISNGRVMGITTVVYIDPVEYGMLEKHEDLILIRDIIGKLNRLLPRRSFILIGPGRWGSRDIWQGIPVTYFDIYNAAMLIEIVHGESRPELPLGTHFFQDLVEANIKYLPLFSDHHQAIFNEAFFRKHNSLEKLLPSYSSFAEVVKIIQIDKIYFGNELVVLMNEDIQKAIAYIHQPVVNTLCTETVGMKEDIGEQGDEGWEWRSFMAKQIASRMDMKAFGVKGVYLFGSTDNRTARHNSDIDLLILFAGNQEQKRRLDIWLNGWSMALADINYLRTGYRLEGLLDVHYVTDEDIKNKTSFAIKISSVYDPATPLRLADEV